MTTAASGAGPSGSHDKQPSKQPSQPPSDSSIGQSGGTIGQLGQGFYWQDLTLGQKLRTYRRTITETDLVNFIGVTGMLEVMFLNADETSGAIGGRPVPAALTYTIIEGFLLQTMIQGTGLALLEMTQKILGPVRAGDAVYGIVEVSGLRPTSKGNRAVVDSTIEVFNQRDEKVMVYTAKRLLAGRPDSAD